jgi:undecaprenyl-diphosphatase
VSHWIVILLGIVEGVTEFLPVSSTGHLLLVEHWLKMSKTTELFNVVIQSGAVIAVLLAFAGRVRQMLHDWRTPAVRDYVAKLMAAFVLTACVGLVLKRLGLELDPEKPMPVAWATLIGGIVILAVERMLKSQSGATVVTWPVAVAVGLAQLLAMSFPGTSRSGASIIIALLFGLSRPAATEFSFLVGVPTLLAAGGFKIVSALRHPGEAHEPWFQILLGTAVAAITAFIVVRWLLRYVQNHTFVLFGWYRVVLGGLILAFLVYRS